MPIDSDKQKKTILLVEDEDHLIYFLQKLLRAEGYNIILAQSGQEAVELYKKNSNNIDLLLLDIVLPDFSGGTVYEEIRKANPNILVLLMSGYPKESFVNIDGLNFIRKPMYPSELLAFIKQIFYDSESAPI